MTEFLHKIVAEQQHAQRNHAATISPRQYVPLYRNTYVPAPFQSMALNNQFVMSNVMTWENEPSWNHTRNIFSDINCEHRWVFEMSESSSRVFRYRCMNCDSSHLQRTRGEIHG